MISLTFIEQIWRNWPSKVSIRIISQVYNLFDIQKHDLYSDTTSHIMYGAYEVCDIEGFDDLVITWGHSKDRRPDRKQIKTGLVVDGNGVIRQVSYSRW